MKITTITMALAFAAGTLGLSGAASAQDHRAPADQGMRHDEQMRHDDMGRDRATHVRRDVRHYERHDRRSWRHGRQHCRTVWRHHRRIRQCW
jgi:Ni/Co efflux regulator RcnB